jgi:hypothetical protein
METLERLDDLWSTRDYPVLLAVARLLRDKPRPLMSHELVEATGLGHHEVVGALTNLGHRHLDVRDASSEGERDSYVVGIMPAGLEAVGQWPSPDAAADRLLAALNTMIDATADGSPKQSRLKAARDGLLAAGRDVIVDVAGAAITGRLPM